VPAAQQLVSRSAGTAGGAISLCAKTAVEHNLLGPSVCVGIALFTIGFARMKAT
jgi:hypothetical protein